MTDLTFILYSSFSCVKSMHFGGHTFSQAPHNVQFSISIAATFGLAIVNGINAAFLPTRLNWYSSFTITGQACSQSWQPVQSSAITYLGFFNHLCFETVFSLFYDLFYFTACENCDTGMP